MALDGAPRLILYIFGVYFLVHSTAIEDDDFHKLLRQNIESLFGYMDENVDSQLTEDELKNWIWLQRQKYIGKDTAKHLEKLDANLNKNIEWSEFYQSNFGWLKPLVSTPKSRRESQVRKMVKREKRKWNMADVDNDKVLNYDEFKAFLYPEDYAHMRMLVVEDRINIVDTDGDGLVSMNEYKAEIYKPESQDEQEPSWVREASNKFMEWDKDRDGKLNKLEALDWIDPAGEDYAGTEAMYLMTTSDDNHDNALTQDEIAAHHEEFGKSLVSNWGEDLYKHTEL